MIFLYIALIKLTDDSLFSANDFKYSIFEAVMTYQNMPIQKITYGTKAESRFESLRKNLARPPEERFRLFIELSALYLQLYPDVPPKSDNNFHIYPNEH